MKIILKVYDILSKVNTNPFKSVYDNEEKNEALGLLDYFDKFCKKHKIQYMLSFGTLLGQHRHKGFIPWDDDIDIAVEEKEFLKNIDKLENDNIGVLSVNRMFIDANKFFKIHYKKNDKIKIYDWSWPFLDIFLYRSDEDKNKIEILANDKTYNLKYENIYPIKYDKFENLTLPIPNKTDIILKRLYSEDYMTTCKSGNWNHKLEWLKKDVTKPCSEVINYLELPSGDE